MEEKKNILTYEGLKRYEDELHELKVVKRQEVAQKIKEAREQGDLSENAEYDAAKDEQRDIEARIEELEKILKNAEVVGVQAYPAPQAIGGHHAHTFSFVGLHARHNGGAGTARPYAYRVQFR